jgi:3-oxoacyl-[acyl-carrier protein] reductase
MAKNLILSSFSILLLSVAAIEAKTIVITSASGELGAATAKVLAIDNDLILTGRNEKKLAALKEELEAKYNGKYETRTLDFMSSDSIQQFKNSLSRVDGLVLIGPRPAFYGKELIQEEDKWLEVIRATFTGPLEVLKATLTQMSEGGKIVVLAGTTSVQIQPSTGPSCVIRRMWTSYAKALSHELGPKKITVNCVSPGVVLTNFHKDRIQKQSGDTGLSYDDQMKKDVAAIPLKRHTQPEEVGQTIGYLMGDQSNFINGVNLVLDGGFTLSY